MCVYIYACVCICNKHLSLWLVTTTSTFLFVPISYRNKIQSMSWTLFDDHSRLSKACHIYKKRKEAYIHIDRLLSSSFTLFLLRFFRLSFFLFIHTFTYYKRRLYWQWPLLRLLVLVLLLFLLILTLVLLSSSCSLNIDIDQSISIIHK